MITSSKKASRETPNLSLREIMEHFVMEFLASFAVVFYSTNQVQEDNKIKVIYNSLSLFFIVMPMTWVSNRISGGHLNPFITVSAHLSNVIRKSPYKTLVVNILGQFTGGFSGFVVLKLVEPEASQSFYNNSTVTLTIVFESIIVFFLVLTYLITTHNNSRARAIYGLTVPCVYAAGAILVGSLYPGRFNPAWYTPVYLIEAEFLWDLLLQIGSGLVSTVLASLIYRFFLSDKIPKDSENKKKEKNGLFELKEKPAENLVIDKKK